MTVFDPDDVTTWPKVLTVAEVGRILRCHENSVYTIIANGKLPAVTIGTKGKRVSRDVMLAYTGPAAVAS